MLCDLITVVLPDILPCPSLTLTLSLDSFRIFFLNLPVTLWCSEHVCSTLSFALLSTCPYIQPFNSYGATEPVRYVTCNQGWEKALVWNETLTMSPTVSVACKSVGVLGCLQRCVGVKHDLVDTRVHLCVFLFVQRQYCSRIWQKLCSYWRTTSCLSMSRTDTQTPTLQLTAIILYMLGWTGAFLVCFCFSVDLI